MIRIEEGKILGGEIVGGGLVSSDIDRFFPAGRACGFVWDF